ncbi:MAG TPA: glycosyltransferase family 2 protein [Candidatus Bathyarchaeia archaeon]|nr:glycosyltransferase family 2 protein [Candidatus Bathyarchaeia archaeon]
MSAGAGARVWAVLAMWNAAERLPATLGALRELEGELALVAIDNASRDASVDRCRELVPAAHVVCNPVNRGFAAAANQGIEHALAEGATHVALLNDDMRLDRRWLAELLAESARDPTVGILGGLILFADRPDTVNSTGLVVDRLWRVRDRHIGEPRRALGALAACDVAGVSGGAMLITRETLEAVGRLDETLFAFYEDFDLCVRARRAGIRSRFVPRAVSWHQFAASTGTRSPLRLRLLARNHLTIIGRYAAPWLAAELIGAIALYRATVRALLWTASGDPAMAAAEIQGAASGLRRGLAELGRRTRGRGRREPDWRPG